MAYSNMLVAVDNTDEAEEIIKVARELADRNKSTISVITVVRPLADYFITSYSPLNDGTAREVESQVVEHATAWLSDLAKRYGIDASAVNVVIGKPATEIRRLAEGLGADLIVIGTHGRHGMGLMLGSTANAVLHGVPCSVLAVRIRLEE